MGNIPMGITNMPETFVHTINNLFIGILDKRLVVFVDDKLIYRSIVEEH